MKLNPGDIIKTNKGRIYKICTAAEIEARFGALFAAYSPDTIFGLTQDSEGWAKLLRYLGKTGPDDELVSIATILESNGLDDALWCLRSLTGYEKEMRLLAVRFAREVSHLMTDPRSLAALNTAEAFAKGQASVQDLDAARLAAYAVAHEAENLSAAVSCAGYTTYVAHAAASTGAATAAAYTAYEAREALAATAAAYAAAYTALEVAGDEAAYAVAQEAREAARGEAALAAHAVAKDRQRNLLLKALKASK